MHFGLFFQGEPGVSGQKVTSLLYFTFEKECVSRLQDVLD